ncbi:ATP-dependent DNA helicase pif1 [Gigaspora margarita]|uniref:ATP-dependent DNA helicase pif1 n=1 Tax=Gigaspora margarita TaxID=4874 RepID=A0A8H4ALS8_GIGMA|nr:ATP-dependent DNA helicase pif1 [Gigaspora margarita]
MEPSNKCRDLIEHKIQELTISAQIEGVTNVTYQTHLAVHLDSIMSQDKTAKEIANLIIAEIEGVNQKLFQHSNNHIESACKLLSKHECDSFQPCLEKRNSDTTAISFITPLLEEIKNHNISISKIYLNTTYKISRGHNELYGTGFLIAYFVLDTTRAMDISTSTGKCRKILEGFLETIKACDINPEFVFTDKDFAEINATTNAMNEFDDFIDPAFYPMEDDCDPNKYIICPTTCQTMVLELIQKHFDMHSLIPVDVQETTLTPADIRRNAVKEMYQFCVKNSLRLLWAYLWTDWYSLD